jgi:hypothetical protein
MKPPIIGEIEHAGKSFTPSYCLPPLVVTCVWLLLGFLFYICRNCCPFTIRTIRLVLQVLQYPTSTHNTVNEHDRMVREVTTSYATIPTAVRKVTHEQCYLHTGHYYLHKYCLQLTPHGSYSRSHLAYLCLNVVSGLGAAGSFGCSSQARRRVASSAWGIGALIQHSEGWQLGADGSRIEQRSGRCEFCDGGVCTEVHSGDRSWLTRWLVAWLAARLSRGLDGWLHGGLTRWLVAWLAARLSRGLASWLQRRLDSRLQRWLGCRLHRGLRRGQSSRRSCGQTIHCVNTVIPSHSNQKLASTVVCDSPPTHIESRALYPSDAIVTGSVNSIITDNSQILTCAAGCECIPVHGGGGCLDPSDTAVTGCVNACTITSYSSNILSRAAQGDRTPPYTWKHGCFNPVGSVIT